MEELRSIVITIEVETNKRSIKHVIHESETTLSGAANRTAEILSDIQESIYG